MIVRLKNRLIVVTAESDEERAALGSFSQAAAGSVFAFHDQDPRTFRLSGLGPRAEACREPINITSLVKDETLRRISNLAESPFELDGEPYGSVEAFWQGLKFPDQRIRREIAPLFGQEARHAGFKATEAESFKYQGQVVRTGTFDHWQLMLKACWAKFTQHEPSREALLSTGERPLEHRVRRDSRNIPGVIMADLWMRIRRGLRNRLAHPPSSSREEPEGGGEPHETADEA